MLMQGDAGAVRAIVELLGLVPYSSSAFSSLRHKLAPSIKKDNSMNPLMSVKWSLIIGFGVSILIAALIGGFVPVELSLARWLHIFFGIFWIGLLYYFNAVQIPALAVAAADKGGPGGAGIAKYIAPKALLWFRHAALGTWFTGVWLLSRSGRLIGAFALGMNESPTNESNLIIGIGAWLGTIMLFNVWVLIWPNQKKVLGIVPATDDEKAKARKIAMLASRTNFLLSVPMLMCMIGPSHGLPF